MGTIAVLSTIVIGSFFYNGGDNLLQDLIIARMEINDGELAGNNRTTESFDKEYDSFMQSSDVLFGRQRDNSEFGNSGYKVYIYQYGVVGLILLIGFFVVSYRKGKDRRAEISSLIVA